MNKSVKSRITGRHHSCTSSKVQWNNYLFTAKGMLRLWQFPQAILRFNDLAIAEDIKAEALEILRRKEIRLRLGELVVKKNVFADKLVHHHESKTEMFTFVENEKSKKTSDLTIAWWTKLYYRNVHAELQLFYVVIPTINSKLQTSCPEVAERGTCRSQKTTKHLIAILQHHDTESKSHNVKTRKDQFAHPEKSPC